MYGCYHSRCCSVPPRHPSGPEHSFGWGLGLAAESSQLSLALGGLSGPQSWFQQTPQLLWEALELRWPLSIVSMELSPLTHAKVPKRMDIGVKMQILICMISNKTAKRTEPASSPGSLPFQTVAKSNAKPHTTNWKVFEVPGIGTMLVH